MGPINGEIPRRHLAPLSGRPPYAWLDMVRHEAPSKPLDIRVRDFVVWAQIIHRGSGKRFRNCALPTFSPYHREDEGGRRRRFL
jgi:hypothetical protein